MSKRRRQRLPLVITEEEYDKFLPNELEWAIFALLVGIILFPTGLLFVFGWNLIVGLITTACFGLTIGAYIVLEFVRRRICIEYRVVIESDEDE